MARTASDTHVDSRREADYTIVAAAGEFDFYTAPLLRDALAEHLASGVTRLIIDLTAVTFMDSSGLGVLVGALKRVRLGDGRMCLVCADPRLLKLFQITGLHRVFEIYAGLEQAVSHCT